MILSAYTFLVVSVAPHTSVWMDNVDTGRPTSVGNIVNWSLFGFFWLLAVISLGNMVFRSPGYVPNNQKFDFTKMNEIDRQIYLEMNLILHSTKH